MTLGFGTCQIFHRHDKVSVGYFIADLGLILYMLLSFFRRKRVCLTSLFIRNSYRICCAFWGMTTLHIYDPCIRGDYTRNQYTLVHLSPNSILEISLICKFCVPLQLLDMAKEPSGLCVEVVGENESFVQRCVLFSYFFHMEKLLEGVKRGESSNDKKNNMKRREHAVCIPYPAQGHVTPLLKIAKLLHSTHGFHISFVNTDHNHRRLLRSRGPGAVSGLPSFRFHSIPDGLPPAANPDATQDIAALCNSINKTGPAALRDLISRLNEDAPLVTCVVADAAMSFAVEVAEELGVPAVRFWTASACALLGYAQYERLFQMGIIPLPDSSCLTNGYLDKVVEGIVPSMEGIALKHLPSFIQTTDASDFLLNYLLRRVHTVSDSRCPLILNTFESLEGPAIQDLADAKITNTPVLPIGPLSLLFTTSNVVENLSTIRSSLLPEDPCCLSWLDAKPPHSVIYINFGSVATLTPHQVTEFAWGLVNSKQNFLWVIRPDLVGEPGSAEQTTRQLVDGAQGRGMLASWCEQERVLAHPALGGFLTHCGWNSTIEALGHGVPVVCWPFFADQMTNGWFCCEKWGVGAEIGGGGEVRRGEVERVVRAVVEGDKGRQMRRKAKEWKRLAEEAVRAPNGSSHLNFNKLVDYLMGS